MSRRKALAYRPSIASLAAVIWITGTAIAQAMGDRGNGGGSGGDGGPGGRRVDPAETASPIGNLPACDERRVYDARLNRCVKAERALPPTAQPATG